MEGQNQKREQEGQPPFVEKWGYDWSQYITSWYFWLLCVITRINRYLSHFDQTFNDFVEKIIFMSVWDRRTDREIVHSTTVTPVVFPQ